MLVSSNLYGGELWESVYYDMSYSELNSLYTLKEASGLFIPDYKDYFGEIIFFQGHYFKPKFIVVSDQVKEVHLISENTILDVVNLYKQYINYYESKFGKPDEYTKSGENYEIYEWYVDDLNVVLTRKGNRQKLPEILIQFRQKPPFNQ